MLEDVGFSSERKMLGLSLFWNTSKTQLSTIGRKERNKVEIRHHFYTCNDFFVAANQI
jgi:hypothetical protein